MQPIFAGKSSAVAKVQTSRYPIRGVSGMRGIVLSVAVVFCLCAFAGADDVPPGHWAYDAVQSLIQEGILQGYPDGSFRGQTPLSRYEFAHALRRAIVGVSRRIEQLAGEMRRPEAPAPQLPAVPPTLPFTEAEREKLRRLPADTAERLQRLEEQMRVLERLLDEFGQDLKLLGEDVRRLRNELSGTESRLRSLERQMRQRVQVSGSLDLIGRGAHGIGGKNAVDLNGYTLTGGLLNNVHVTHELSLQVGTEIAEGVRTEAELVVGNYPSYLGSASQFAVTAKRAPGATDFLLWKANVRVPVHLFGRQGALSVGRIENRMTPLTLWRPDVDVYTPLPRYDSGYYSMDGLKFQLDTDLANVMLYAARHNTVGTNLLSDFMRVSAGVDPLNLFQPGNPVRQRPNRIPYGIVHARHSAGASALLKLGREASVGAQFIVLDAGRDLPTALGAVNQANVWGWQADWAPSDRWDFALVYAQCDLLHHGDNRLNRDNWAFLARVQYRPSDRASVWLGYREFRPYFAPPGYWGRIGYWHNPTDLRGVDIGVRTRTGNLGLEARGGFYAGTGKASPPAGFGTDDRVSHVVVNALWQTRPRWQVGLTYEGVMWRLSDPLRFNPNAGLSAPGKPVENYLTLTVGYDMGRDTRLRLLYQIIDYDAKGVGSYSLLGTGKERGGVAVVQMSTAF